MNLCVICGGKVFNHNPLATLCGNPICREVKATGKSQEQIVFEDSRIEDDRMEAFGLGHDGKYARKIEHD